MNLNVLQSAYFDDLNACEQSQRMLGGYSGKCWVSTKVLGRQSKNLPDVYKIGK